MTILSDLQGAKDDYSKSFLLKNTVKRKLSKVKWDIFENIWRFFSKKSLEFQACFCSRCYFIRLKWKWKGKEEDIKVLILLM